MNIKEKISNWKQNRRLRKFKDRNITKARFLYLYIVFSGIAMLVYAISCLITGFPFIYTFIPIVLLISYFALFFIKKNFKLFWLYTKDTQQGRLLLFLNENTHFKQEHKLRLIKWVYLRRKSIRNEKWLELSNKVRKGIELTGIEKKQVRYNVRICPQQLLDGINKAILVHCLIYAHENIRALDNDLRDNIELTDKHILSFDIQKEINRCKTKEAIEKYKNYMNLGKKLTEQDKA